MTYMNYTPRTLDELLAAYDFPEFDKKRKEMIESDIPNG